MRAAWGMVRIGADSLLVAMLEIGQVSNADVKPVCGKGIEYGDSHGGFRSSADE
jgi:hypothetical protein